MFSAVFLGKSLLIRVIYSPIKCQDSVRVNKENMGMGLARPGTKNGCAGEDQQQFTRN
jgi:hypothetical protein